MGGTFVRRLAVALVFLSTFSLGAARMASAATPPDFWGLKSGGDYLTTEGGWNAFADSGADVYRGQFSWDVVQTNIDCDRATAVPGGPSDPVTYNFSDFDLRVKRAAIRGIRVLPYLYGSVCFDSNPLPNPPEAKDENRSMHFPAPGSNEYEPWLAYVRAVVKRYGYNGSFWAANPTVPYKPIKTWEVWNEPNYNVNNPGGTDVYPKKYARFLIDTSDAIRTAQADIATNSPTVLLGGLSTLVPDEEIDDFLSSMYSPPPPTSPDTYTAAEAHAAFDGLALHPYVGKYSYTYAVSAIEDARTVLDSDGDTDKSIWVTEFGWAVGTLGISEADQATNISELMNWMRNYYGGYDIRAAILYFMRDTPHSVSTDPNSPPVWPDFAGLKTLAGFNRASWCTYVDIVVEPTCPNAAAPGSSPDIERDQPSGYTFIPYRNVNGGITYWYWQDGGGWTGRNLGGSVASGTNPTVERDPASGYTMIAYRDTNSRISLWYRESNTGGWTNMALGSDVAGDVAANTSPALSRDPSTGTTFIAYRNTSGGVTAWLWTTAWGWVKVALGGSVAANTSPDITRDPTSGITFIPYRDVNGRISYWKWDATWAGGTLGAASAGTVASDSSPRVSGDPSGNTIVAFKNTSGGISTWSTPTGATWTQTTLGGTAAASTTTPVQRDPGTGYTLIAFRNSSGGISYWRWQSGSGWALGSLAATVSSNSGPALYQDQTTPTIMFPYTDAAGSTVNPKVSVWQWTTALSWNRFTP